jgi:uncharacterized membrane protein YqgA involved in biofilm formation
MNIIGLGTLINIIFIITGSILGLTVKGKLNKTYQDGIMNALGLAVMFIGISKTLEGMFTLKGSHLVVGNVMLMILSLVSGAFLGELIDIEKWFNMAGEAIKRALKVDGENGNGFVEGFVNSTILFCVGAMAIMGAIDDGLTGDYSTLAAKGVLDGVVSIFFASTHGIGVLFSVLPLGLYQGVITYSATLIKPLLSDRLITNLSLVGSVMIFGIGINMLFGKKIKCGNLLPALLMPVVYEIIMKVVI